jgi:hypothetical protein
VTADTVSVYAIRHLWLGDVDPVTGEPSTQAWRQLGFDIDGKATTKASRDVCTLAPGAPWDAQDDGNGGVDNGFGENVLPIIALAEGASFAQDLNDSIASGLVTDLLVVRGLGSPTTASPLSAELLVGAPLGATPSWSGTDVWPIDSSSVKDGDATQPLLAFGSSFVTGSVFVAEPPSGDGEIALGVFRGAPWVIPIRHVQVAMTLSADGSTATNGALSGLLPADRFLDVARRLAPTILSSLCGPDVWLSIAQQIEQSEDILLDGTNEPGQPCDAISIGLGFDAVRVQMGPVVDVAPLGDECPPPDAGP